MGRDGVRYGATSMNAMSIRRRASQAGATTLEYIMIISLFSVPLSIWVGRMIEWALRNCIAVIIESFTRG